MAAREQGRDDFEGWILRCRADERQSAALDVRQEIILLTFVEVMNLIDKKHGRLAETLQALGFLNNRFEFLDAGSDRGKIHAGGASGTRQDLCQRGFAAPRRTPQNQRAEFARAGDAT